MRRAAEMGVRALKLHPCHMAVEPNAYLHGLDALRAIYEEAQRLRLPVMIHTGTSIFPGARSRAGEPMPVDDVAVDFPELTLILAHGGRPLWMEQAFFLVRRFPQVYMDVSSIPPKAILRYFPRLAEVADKVLYGSDWPSPGVTSMAKNLAEFRALGLPARRARQDPRHERPEDLRVERVPHKESIANLAERSRIGNTIKRESIELFLHNVEEGRVLEMQNATHYVFQSNQREVLEAKRPRHDGGRGGDTATTADQRFIRPWQVGQARTSTAKVHARSSAHGAVAPA